MGKRVEHEFLWFDISSPNNQHTSIVIAERGGGGVHSPNSDTTQAADTLAQADTMVDTTASPLTPPETSALSPDVGNPTASSANESSPLLDKVTKSDGKIKQKTNTAQFAASFSSSFKRAAGDWVEGMCNRPRLVCTLSFTGAKPTANELATLLYVTSAQEPKHNLHDTQCHWFATTVFDALNILYEGAEQDPTPHQVGMICGVSVNFKASRQEQEEQRQQECEQCQAADEAVKRAEEERQRECKQCEAAEQERQKECKQCKVAEERAQAAQEEIEKLLQEVEALKRAGASTQQA
ncbi:hypothetical protein F5J12DRAFT_787661 [Pisolithus orientalis]|uniref:uncharacterized protein n=1 Tax=Pisolithus orientalis TaxID=936130 RepID=UPI0022243A3F|nr:uncharacterized protein F5J12DRAFT_787661 [Pisolithus orientalis]KAI5984111.1 hypothetical protein F5J12DRAFT_787661 [Pisolithus orientalis]